MADGIADESVMGDQHWFSRLWEDGVWSLYSPTEHSGNTVRAVVRFEAQGLLTCRVPHTHHEDEAWVDDGFDEPEKEAVDGDASKVVACRRGHEQATPYCGLRLELSK